MALQKQTNGSGAQYVDALLSSAPRGTAGTAPRRPDLSQAVRPDSAESELPPFPLGDQADLRAERKWLEEERKGLEAYLHHQFAAIREERDKLVAQESKINETLALRQHKITRQTALLVARAEALRQREKELSELDATLATQLEKVTRAEEEVQALQLAGMQLQKDNDAQRALAEQCGIARAGLQEQVEQTRKELAALAEVRQRARKAAEEEQAEFATRRQQMEQRYAALEKAEQGLQRRTVELDELESRLQGELEQREHRVARKQRKIEKIWKRLKQTSAMVRRDREAHRILSEQHRTETTQLQEAARQARAELAHAEEALVSSRATREKAEAEWKARHEQAQTAWTVQRQQEETDWTAQRQHEEADWTTRRAQLEQDTRALAEAQDGLRRRQAEVEEAATRIQQERDHCEQELVRGRRDIELLGANLRSQAQKIESELSKIFGAENWRSVLELLAPPKQEAV